MPRWISLCRWKPKQGEMWHTIQRRLRGQKRTTYVFLLWSVFSTLYFNDIQINFIWIYKFFQNPLSWCLLTGSNVNFNSNVLLLQLILKYFYYPYRGTETNKGLSTTKRIFQASWSSGKVFISSYKTLIIKSKNLLMKHIIKVWRYILYILIKKGFGMPTFDILEQIVYTSVLVLIMLT